MKHRGGVTETVAERYRNTALALQASDTGLVIRPPFQTVSQGLQWGLKGASKPFGNPSKTLAERNKPSVPGTHPDKLALNLSPRVRASTTQHR